MRLEDQVAIITGATSGIGKACAERFAREGARVVLSGRRADLGHAIAEPLVPSGSRSSRPTYCTSPTSRRSSIGRSSASAASIA